LLECSGRAGAETLRGLSHPYHVPSAAHGRDQAEADRDSGAPVRSASNRRNRKARERRSEEALAKVSAENPGRAKPKGGSSVQQAKPLSDRQGLSGGSIPRNRGPSGRSGASAAGALRGWTVCGLIRVVTPRMPARRESLRRVNPKSAAGVKHNRHGS
jgi:hypothetical protein